MFRPEIDWLRKWARYTPGKLLLREHARDISWTYADLDRRADALAAHLRDAYGLQSGDRIAVCSRNRSECVFLFFACVKLGTVLVPLNFRLKPRELDILIRDCEASLFVYEQELAAQLQGLQTLGTVPHCQEIAQLDPFLTGPVPDIAEIYTTMGGLDSTVMILYTAGTTGLPKGAMITHRMLLWNAINTTLRLDLTSADHTQSFAPFFHTGGWNVLFTPFLHNGASHTLLSRFDPDLVLQLMEKERTTLFFGVPTMLQMMADSPLFEKSDLASVRYAIVGGAPMPIPLINVWHEKGVAIRQGYGLTEVGPNCFSLHQDDAIRKKGSIGFPNFYVDAKIVGEDGTECAAGEVGELWLRSEVVTPGYWRKEAETAAAITTGWFHTGDMVRQDEEGFFYVVDRKKNMYISGGENVYPVEVEQFLTTHPDIKDIAVLGVPDPQWGEVGKAFVVLYENRSITEEEVQEYCRGELAKYKIPQQVVFVASLPRNEAGKIDRSELEKMA